MLFKYNIYGYRYISTYIQSTQHCKHFYQKFKSKIVKSNLYDNSEFYCFRLGGNQSIKQKHYAKLKGDRL